MEHLSKEASASAGRQEVFFLADVAERPELEHLKVRGADSLMPTAPLPRKVYIVNEKHDPKPKNYKFFVGTEKFETDQPALTGAQIKAYVANVPPGTKLSLEGHGNDPDQIIADDQLVPLDEQHGGPRRFTLVPPANFG